MLIIFCSLLNLVYAVETQLQNNETEVLDDMYFCPGGGCSTNTSGASYVRIGIANSYPLKGAFRFDISFMNENYSVSDSKLGLYKYTSTSLSNNTCFVYEFLNETWIEEIENNNNQPASYGDLINETVAPTSGWIISNVQSYVEEFRANSSLSFIVNKSEPDSWDELYVYSKESENTTLRPYLNITYIYYTVPGVIGPNITPSPANDTNDLNCSVTPDDAEYSSLNVSFIWYINDAINDSFNATVSTTNNTLTYTDTLLNSTVISANDSIVCSVRIENPYNTTAWINSTKLGLNDSTSPIISNILIPSTGTKDSISALKYDCTDTIAISEAFVNVTTPAGVTSEQSMTLDSGNTYLKNYVPLTTGDFIVNNFRCVDTSSNEVINYSNHTMTVEINVVGGGGGGSYVDEVCDFSIVVPTNRKIELHGKEGLYAKTWFSIRNNASNSKSVSFRSVNINCDIESNPITIQGNSVSRNYVTCTFPPESQPQSGYIEMTDDSCNTKIDVVLISDFWGELLTYLNGSAGLGYQIVSWSVVLLVVGLIIFIIIAITGG